MNDQFHRDWEMLMALGGAARAVHGLTEAITKGDFPKRATDAMAREVLRIAEGLTHDASVLAMEIHDAKKGRE